MSLNHVIFLFVHEKFLKNCYNKHLKFFTIFPLFVIRLFQNVMYLSAAAFCILQISWQLLKTILSMRSRMSCVPKIRVQKNYLNGTNLVKHSSFAQWATLKYILLFHSEFMIFTNVQMTMPGSSTTSVRFPK